MVVKKLIKVFFICITIIIISYVVYIVNSIFGNPISAAIATAKIKSYAEVTYPDMKLEVPKAAYNFKNSEYYSKVQSKISQDTCFIIGWRRGNINDQYEYEVANRFSTYRRMQNEFNNSVKDIISEEFPYETSILIADFAKEDGDFSSLTLDMPLDIKHPPLETYLTIYMLSDKIDYEIFSKRLIELKELMNKHQIPIDLYSVVIEKPMPEGEKADPNGQRLSLYDFPSDKLDEPDLVEAIKKHQELWEEKANDEKKNEIMSSVK